MSFKPSEPKPTVLTLILPETDSESKTGILLVQRGDLANVRQFTYIHIADLTEVIADALIAFTTVEANPPVISEPPPTKPQAAQKAVVPSSPAEPTVDVPLKKGTKTVRISHLKIVGGETDAAAYRQAVLLAGKLIDGKLWDGETPIRFDDVYAVAKKMKYLTERDLSLFTLADFVQVGTGELPVLDDEARSDNEPSTIRPPDPTEVSANGLHSDNGASAQSVLL